MHNTMIDSYFYFHHYTTTIKSNYDCVYVASTVYVLCTMYYVLCTINDSTSNTTLANE
jgi:hypothetical protein